MDPPERIAVTASHQGMMKLVENDEANNNASNW
jgi:hypothetical protein